jgi:hypothetical protein
MGWLALRATEQQTRRLESVEANRRNKDLGTVIRPPSPAIRFLPTGVALETTNRSDAAPPFGTRMFDRIRPETSAEPPASHSDGSASLTSSGTAGAATPHNDKTSTNSGPARTPAPSGLHSPLDLLFHSQN